MGGSGGAIAIATANRILMLEHSIYSVISPEGCASILWRSADKVQEATEALKLTAQDLRKFGVIDEIIKEPVGGAHRDPKTTIEKVGDIILKHLKELLPLSGDELKSSARPSSWPWGAICRKLKESHDRRKFLSALGGTARRTGRHLAARQYDCFAAARCFKRVVFVGGYAVPRSGRTGRTSDPAVGNNQNSQNRIAEAINEQKLSVLKIMDEKLLAVTKSVGDGLQQSTAKTTETLHDLRERLAKIDVAQQKISSLSEQVVSLQEVLSNKQARGAFGEIQLNDLVTSALPPSAYAFQVVLGNQKRADCVLNLPNPPGMIVIDSKFPLESYQALRNAQTDREKVEAERFSVLQC